MVRQVLRQAFLAQAVGATPVGVDTTPLDFVGTCPVRPSPFLTLPPTPVSANPSGNFPDQCDTADGGNTPRSNPAVFCQIRPTQANIGRIRLSVGRVWARLGATSANATWTKFPRPCPDFGLGRTTSCDVAEVISISATLGLESTILRANPTNSWPISTKCWGIPTGCRPKLAVIALPWNGPIWVEFVQRFPNSTNVARLWQIRNAIQHLRPAMDPAETICSELSRTQGVGCVLGRGTGTAGTSPQVGPKSACTWAFKVSPPSLVNVATLATPPNFARHRPPKGRLRSDMWPKQLGPACGELGRCHPCCAGDGCVHRYARPQRDALLGRGTVRWPRARLARACVAGQHEASWAARPVQSDTPLLKDRASSPLWRKRRHCGEQVRKDTLTTTSVPALSVPCRGDLWSTSGRDPPADPLLCARPRAACSQFPVAAWLRGSTRSPSTSPVATPSRHGPWSSNSLPPPACIVCVPRFCVVGKRSNIPQSRHARTRAAYSGTSTPTTFGRCHMERTRTHSPNDPPTSKLPDTIREVVALDHGSQISHACLKLAGRSFGLPLLGSATSQFCVCWIAYRD